MGHLPLVDATSVITPHNANETKLKKSDKGQSRYQIQGNHVEEVNYRNKIIGLRTPQSSQQFSTAAKVFCEHHENSAAIANLDESILVDISAHKNDVGLGWNENHGPVILLRQNGSTPIFQLEDLSHDSSRSFQTGSKQMQTSQNTMQDIFDVKSKPEYFHFLGDLAYDFCAER